MSSRDVFEPFVYAGFKVECWVLPHYERVGSERGFGRRQKNDSKNRSMGLSRQGGLF